MHAPWETKMRRFTKIFFPIIVLIMLLGAGISVSATNIEPAPISVQQLLASADEGLIVFSSKHKGVDQIYLIRPDGTDLTRLSRTEFEESFPAWSPDGTKIGFT
jgi:hypothetical protein